MSLTSAFGQVGYPSNGAFPGTGDFRTNWSLGATVQVPVFTGDRLHAGRTRGAAPNLAEAQAQLKQARELAVLDAATAAKDLTAAEATWRGQRRHDRAGRARVSDRRTAQPRRPVDAARADRTRACRCRSRKPTAPRPRATCRSRAPASRCCPICPSRAMSVSSGVLSCVDTFLRSLLAGVGARCARAGAGRVRQPRRVAAPPAAGGAAVVQLAPENTVVAVSRRRSRPVPTMSGPAHARARGDGPRAGRRLDRRAARSIAARPSRPAQVIARISSRDLDDAHSSRRSGGEVGRDDAGGRARAKRSAPRRSSRAARWPRAISSRPTNAVTMAEAQVCGRARRGRSRSGSRSTTRRSRRRSRASSASVPPISATSCRPARALRHDHRSVEHAARGARCRPISIQQVQSGRQVHVPRARHRRSDFAGTVDRLSPTADPVTRQVVDLRLAAEHRRQADCRSLRRRPRRDRDAQGHRGAARRPSTKPAPAPSVTRIRDGKAERVVGRARPATDRDRAGRSHEGPRRRRRADRRLGQGHRHRARLCAIVQ